MMPPFEGDDFHYEMMKEAALEGESEEEEEIQPVELSSKARLFGNPTPFPNEALLEKLSNKLAQEEEEESLN